MQNTEVIILAGGKGTRMGSDMPKALTNLLGRSFVERIVHTLSSITDKKPIVVVGHKGEEVMRCLGEKCTYASQEVQLGTGHAVMCASDMVHPNTETVVVLYADHPLVSGDTIREAVQKQRETGAHIVMTPTTVEDFEDWRASFLKWGRVKRDKIGQIEAVVEFKDATEEEKNIREVTPGYFAFDAGWLWENLKKLSNDNAQKEYYLTYLVNIARAEGKIIESISINPKEALGANTKEELEVLELFAV